MKCNKCGTPIITGEEVCRFCGTKADFSKREIEPEVIDFDIEDEPIPATPIIIPSEIKPNNISVSNNVEKVKVEPVINKVEEKKEANYSGDLLLEDFSPAGESNPLEDYSNMEVTNQEVIEDEMIIENPIDELDKKETIAEEKIVVEETSKVEVVQPIVKEEKVKPIKEKKVSDKKGSPLAIILVIILMASVAINVYLFLNKDNVSATEKETTTATVETQETAYGNFEYEMPGSWVTQENEITKNMIAYDEKKTWAASFSVVENLNYKNLIAGKDNVSEALGASKYLFTSDYSKEVNGKSMYLFKGKYYNYSVYIIITKVEDNTVLVTDLKFQGEVSDTILNQILDVCSSIKTNDVTTLYTENFEFNNVNALLEGVLTNQ